MIVWKIKEVRKGFEVRSNRGDKFLVIGDIVKAFDVCESFSVKRYKVRLEDVVIL